MKDSPDQLTIKKVENQVTTPGQLLELAINKDLDIDKLAKLMELQREYNADLARKAFYEALSAFQEECPDLRKTKPVHYKKDEPAAYYYAPLADIDRQIKPLLKKHGLSKRFEIVQEADKIKGVTCIVTHILGHSESTTIPTIVDLSGGKNAIQGIGSGVQYGQRYSLIAALGITTADQDIDGRMPELDIDKLHKQYMEVYNQCIQKDSNLSVTMNPDNWDIERTPNVYVQAIGKARQVLAKLQKNGL